MLRIYNNNNNNVISPAFSNLVRRSCCTIFSVATGLEQLGKHHGRRGVSEGCGGQAAGLPAHPGQPHHQGPAGAWRNTIQRRLFADFESYVSV